MTRIYKTAFAEIGDREALADTDPGTGKVSLPAGWTPDYEKENDDPNYRPVGRKEMNGVLHEVTSALGEMQQFGFSAWQPVSGGWPVGANVRHADGYWQSLANANTEEPGAGALWKELLFGNLVPASETIRGVIQLATTAQAQALTDDTRALTPKKLADLGAVFPGEVRTFAGPVANVPDGWLPCNGATISRTTYSRLFAVIGTTYGDGDGSTTFNIPDLRGEFVRGLDNGRGVDAGRSLGSAQLDQMQRITGQIAANATGWTGQVPGALRAYDAGINSLAGSSGGTAWRGLEFDSIYSPNARTSETTDGETRPRNVAMNYIIKY